MLEPQQFPMTVFISGPYSHPTRKVRQINTEMAMDAALEVIHRGHYPYCPHLSHYLDEHQEAIAGSGIDYETWMRVCLAFLSKCQAILFLGESPGSLREMQMAAALHLKIYRTTEDLPHVNQGGPTS